MYTSSSKLRSDGYFYIPGVETIRRLYASTAAGCLIRKLVVDIWTAEGTIACLDPVHDVPNEFMQDLCLSLLDKRDRVASLIDHADMSPHEEPEHTQVV